MEYFDFIKPGDLDNLPEDPQLAFSEFVRIAQARLVERLQQLNGNEQDDWHLMLEAKHGFQNVVTGAARKYAIEPFASEDVPMVRKYDDDAYKQFRADLSHYITQIMLNAAEVRVNPPRWRKRTGSNAEPLQQRAVAVYSGSAQK